MLLALEERGLYFQGMVKTAHKEYPMGFMKDWGKWSLERGSAMKRRVVFVRIKDTMEHKHVCTWLEGQKIEDHYFKCRYHQT